MQAYAMQGLIELIALFPSTTYFFFNCWTWGYEDLLIEIMRAFHCSVGRTFISSTLSTWNNL